MIHESIKKAQSRNPVLFLFVKFCQASLDDRAFLDCRSDRFSGRGCGRRAWRTNRAHGNHHLNRNLDTGHFRHATGNRVRNLFGHALDFVDRASVLDRLADGVRNFAAALFANHLADLAANLTLTLFANHLADAVANLLATGFRDHLADAVVLDASADFRNHLANVVVAVTRADLRDHLRHGVRAGTGFRNHTGHRAGV